MLKTSRSRLLYLILALTCIAAMTFLGPQEKSLGANVRLVYLHGAWVLTAEVIFLASALAGAVALVTRREGLHAWSQALGWTGTLFWVTYLPLSMWAMQSNWNGLFLAEPRFRLALIFAVTAILLQGGLWLFDLPWLTSLANILFIIVLRIAFSTTTYIMHPPPSPSFNSGNSFLIIYFLTLNLLTWVAAYLVTRLGLLHRPSKTFNA
ncbi:MAG: hypothetical protein ABIJ65_08065 [Chloroflexota bacterium]